MPETNLFPVIETLLSELLDGAGAENGWMLNPKDPGLFASLDKLSAAQASAIPAAGGSSVAAHVDHLRYGFELLNRRSRGEQPFADADYSASWKRSTVTEAEWAARRDALRNEANTWRDALKPREMTDRELTGIISSVAHLAYHLGAIRQIDRSIKGPSATD